MTRYEQAVKAYKASTAGLLQVKEQGAEALVSAAIAKVVAANGELMRARLAEERGL